jgi:predicted deacetylase
MQSLSTMQVALSAAAEVAEVAEVEIVWELQTTAQQVAAEALEIMLGYHKVEMADRNQVLSLQVEPEEMQLQMEPQAALAEILVRQVLVGTVQTAQAARAEQLVSVLQQDPVLISLGYQLELVTGLWGKL